MKHKEKIFLVLLVTVLTHYFVLTFFNVDQVESFVGSVEKIETSEKGLFPLVNIKFKTTNELSGNHEVITRTISLMKNDLKKFKIGSKYQIKSHKNWLVSSR